MQRIRPALTVLPVLVAAVAAQEPIHTTAATQPGVGRAVLREQLHWYVADDGAVRTEELLLDSSLLVGLRRDLALGIEVPASLQSTDDFGPDTTEGNLGDVRVLGKWRVHTQDSGPIDTRRASLIFGASLDTANSDATSLRPGFARGSTDAILGAVITRIDGRTGLNAAVEATLSTAGRSDDFRYDGAWLYRLSPATFTAEREVGWYLVAELNGRYETNGDNEILVAPGLMYEASRMTMELSVQLPAWQELDHREEIDFAVVIGFRFLF